MAGLPLVSRLTARRDLLATLPLTGVIATLSPVFCGLVGRKALNMPDNLVAALMASHFVGLLLAGPVGGYLSKTRKIIAITRLLLMISVALMSVALIPAGPAGGVWQYVLVLQIFVGHVGLGQVTTLRTAIWRANYPAQHRAKITVVIGVCIMFGSSLAVFIFTRGMDVFGLSFRSIYFTSGVCGILAAWSFSRIRIRHERQTLRTLGEQTPRQAGIWAALDILRRDRAFRHYMGWQMLNGFSVMIVEFVLVVILVGTFDADWTSCGAALTVVPFLVAGASSILWAPLFDRNNIAVVRAYNAAVWVLSKAFLFAGVLTLNMPLVLVSRAITGVARGGGQVLWRLGHMQFAPPEHDSIYMALHVSLTGLRGIVASFLALNLYRLDCMGPNGLGLIALSAVAQVIAGIGFFRMRKHAGRRW